MKISGPHFDPRRKDANKSWYLSYFAAVLDASGKPKLENGSPIKKRYRPYFETKKAAKAEKESLGEQYNATGSGVFVHSREALVDYEAAKRVLPKGVSMLTAAKFFLKHNPEVVPATIEQRRTDFLDYMEKLHGRDRHLSDLKSRTQSLVDAFASRVPDTITRREAMAYLFELPCAPRTKLNHKRVCCNFFNWMLTIECCVSQNPFGGIKRKQLPKIVAKEVRFLSLEQVERYLRAAERYDPEIVAHEVLQFFAGVRADDEMASFRGEWVQPELRQVLTPEEMTKSGIRDVIDGLEDNFWKWWEIYGHEGLLRPENYGPRFDRVRILAAVADQSEADRLAVLPFKTLRSPRHMLTLKEWPWNARRRTFCSYKVAKDGSAGTAAQILRHKGGEGILRKSYLGLGITKKQGEAYFGLLPRKVEHPILSQHEPKGIVRLQKDPSYRGKTRWPRREDHQSGQPSAVA